MIIRVYGTNYKVKQSFVSSAKSTIQKILENVRVQSKLKGIEKYYTAFVVMMYVVSSSILKNLSSDNIKEILTELEKDEPSKPETEEKPKV